jgi:uncharacterized protein YecE (DUF72 family)
MIAETHFDRTRLTPTLSALAQAGVFIGTSSWKYAGWRGMLYDESRYIYRGKVAETRFEKNCLAEYAEVFKTVCVDAAYYTFPTERYLEGLVSQVPQDFLFTFKVTDHITIKKYTNLPRFGLKAGKPNEHFLDADLFQAAFLKPCEKFKQNVGVLIFEFSHFYQSDFERGRDFVEALDQFLQKLPKGWRYGVEIRNKNFLHQEYFAALHKHGVAHVFNSWAGMPTVTEQLEQPNSQTADGFSAARFLLKPGRTYEQAVKEFSPYKEVKEVNNEARRSGAKLIQQAKQQASQTFIYVNNRLEGNALETINAMLQLCFDSGVSDAAETMS